MEIRITEKAEQQLKKLNPTALKLIIKYLKKLETLANPAILGKPLKGKLREYIRYRVGNYRIICFIEQDALIINLIEVGHRKNIYKQFSF